METPQIFQFLQEAQMVEQPLKHIIDVMFNALNSCACAGSA